MGITVRVWHDFVSDLLLGRSTLPGELGGQLSAPHLRLISLQRICPKIYFWTVGIEGSDFLVCGQKSTELTVL